MARSSSVPFFLSGAWCRSRNRSGSHQLSSPYIGERRGSTDLLTSKEDTGVQECTPGPSRWLHAWSLCRFVGPVTLHFQYVSLLVLWDPVFLLFPPLSMAFVHRTVGVRGRAAGLVCSIARFEGQAAGSFPRDCRIVSRSDLFAFATRVGSIPRTHPGPVRTRPRRGSFCFPCFVLERTRPRGSISPWARKGSDFPCLMSLALPLSFPRSRPPPPGQRASPTIGSFEGGIDESPSPKPTLDWMQVFQRRTFGIQQAVCPNG